MKPNKYIYFFLKIISDNSSLSGPGPLSKLFESVQEEVPVLLESAGSGLPSAQNNPLAKVAYFRAGYSPGWLFSSPPHIPGPELLKPLQLPG